MSQPWLWWWSTLQAVLACSLLSCIGGTSAVILRPILTSFQCTFTAFACLVQACPYEAFLFERLLTAFAIPIEPFQVIVPHVEQSLTSSIDLPRASKCSEAGGSKFRHPMWSDLMCTLAER
jgi:hypothetical protein